MLSIFSALNLYLARTYLKNFILILIALLTLIYIFDTVELLRRTSGSDALSFIFVLQLGLYKLPDVGQQIFTFAILFSGILTFWHLTKRHELVILRAAGLSAWQFILPIILCAFLIGAVKIMAVNPLGALFMAKYESLETKYLKQNGNLISLSKQGLWLRQNDNNQFSIIHADKVTMPQWELDNIKIFSFSSNYKFLQRIDAKTAIINENIWELRDVTTNKPGYKPEFSNNVEYKTDITRYELENSFSSPQSISFWHFPAQIEILKSTGLNARPLLIYYHQLMAQPLLFISMILLAAAVSFRSPRRKGGTLLIILGITLGFTVFYLTNFLGALGASGQIPLLIAAWFPAIITFLAGMTSLLITEDG